MNKAGIFALGSLFYLMLCIISINFWRSKKYWVRWGILSMVVIHLFGWVYFVLYYGLLTVSGLGICVIIPIFCIAPLILDLAVLHQVFTLEEANISS
jgi:hypothetical protein